MQKTYLAFEFTLLFLAVPVGLCYLPWKIPPLPVLWAAMGFCLFVLLRDSGFDRSLLWNPAALSANLGNIFLLFAISALVIGVGVYFLVPQMIFGFVRASPGFWALVMLLYPVLSVYPQALIYRAFLMHRYEPIFGLSGTSPLVMVLVSAFAFSLMHVIFRNPLAIVLTLLGGVLFAYRYQKTGSLFVSCFEHALYGCFLFTIGLGRYFYARSIWKSHHRHIQDSARDCWRTAIIHGRFIGLSDNPRVRYDTSEIETFIVGWDGRKHGMKSAVR